MIEEAAAQAERGVGRRLDQGLLHRGRSAVLDLNRGGDPDPVGRPVLDQEGGQGELNVDVRRAVDEQLHLPVRTNLGAAGERVELAAARRRAARPPVPWRAAVHFRAGGRARPAARGTGRSPARPAPGAGAVGSGGAARPARARRRRRRRRGGGGVGVSWPAQGAVGPSATRRRRGRRWARSARRRGESEDPRDPRRAQPGRRRHGAAEPTATARTVRVDVRRTRLQYPDPRRPSRN